MVGLPFADGGESVGVDGSPEEDGSEGGVGVGHNSGINRHNLD